MIRTLKATIDEKGVVHLLEPIALPRTRRAFVTILEEPPFDLRETALLSEATLAEDWNQPEEDAAWLHLQSAR